MIAEKKLTYGTVCSPWWDDRPLYIVGGGPSLTGFDFARLRGRILTVNESLLYLLSVNLPPDAVFSMDNNWARHRFCEMSRFRGEKYLAVQEFYWPYVDQAATMLARVRRSGLSDDPGAIHICGTSGYGALNLAYLKRAREVYLLGFDMAGGHWHPEPAWGGGIPLDPWAAAFDDAAVQLRAAGVRVWNCSPDSKITAFPKISLEEI
jgi:hypothetical protein